MSKKISKKIIFIPICLILAIICGWIAYSQLSHSENYSHSSKGIIDFYDQSNHRIVMNHYPNKLLILAGHGPIVYYSTARNMQALEAIDLRAYKKLGKSIYSKIMVDFPGLKNKAMNLRTLGSKLFNIETIISLEPDAVIQFSHKAKKIKQVRDAGLNAIAWDCCSEENRLGYIKITGILSGENERADKIIALNKASRKKIRAISKDKTPVPIIEFDKSGKNMRVLTNKFSSSLYHISGVRNVAKDGNIMRRIIDIEQIIKWNPAIMLVSSWSKLKVKKIYKDKRLQHIKAIRNKNLFAIPKFNFVPYSPESFLTAEWLYIIAHNDVKMAKQFRQRIKDVYQKVYGYSLSDDDIDNILNMDINQHSGKYRLLFSA